MKYFLYAIVGRKRGRRKYDLIGGFSNGRSALFPKLEHAETFLGKAVDKFPEYEFRIVPATTEIDLVGIQA